MLSPTVLWTRSLVFFSLLTSCCSSTLGQGFGVGIIGGDPTGLSVKKWLESGNAIDAAAAWSFEAQDAFQLHANYLWHRNIPAISETIHGWLPFYFGLGGRLRLVDGNRWHGDEARVGIRIPLGVTYVFEQAPLDLFFEVAPTLDVAPRTDADFDAAIGIRFYFR